MTAPSLDESSNCPCCQNWIKSSSLGCPICGWRPLPQSNRPWQNERYLNLTAIGLMVAIICVCSVLFLAAPGLGVLFAVLALAPTARTLLVLRQRQKQTISTPTSTFIWMYLGSISFTAALVVTCFFVVMVTFFVCLFLQCTGLANLGFDNSGYQNWWLWILGIVVLAFMTLSFVLIRVRWRWDTQPPYPGKPEHEPFKK